MGLGPASKKHHAYKKLTGNDAYNVFGIKDALQDWGRLNNEHIGIIRNKCREWARGNAQAEMQLESNLCFRVWRLDSVDTSASFENQRLSGKILPNQLFAKEGEPMRYSGDLISGKQLTYYFPPRPKDNEKLYKFAVTLEFVTLREDLI
jgi:hypothetical protein